MIQVLEGKLLDKLKSNDDHEAKKLYDSLITVCKVVEPYIDALPHSKGSLTGINHTRGVLHEVENLISGSDYLNLSAAEIYILLVAILIHDIGKLDEEDTKDEEKNLKNKLNEKFKNYKEFVSEALGGGILNGAGRKIESEASSLDKRF